MGDPARDQTRSEQPYGRMFGVLDNLPHFVYLQSDDGEIHYTNKKFVALFGTVDGELCFRHFKRGDEFCKDCPTLRVFETGESQTRPFLGPDCRRYRIHESIYRDPELGVLAMKVGSDVEDITEAMEEAERAHDEAVRAKAEAHAILDSPRNVMIVALTHDLRIRFYNKNFQQFYGAAFGVEPKVGDYSLDYLQFEESAEVAADLLKRSDKGERPKRLRSYTINGEVRHVEFHVQRSPIAENEPDGYTVFAIDVTQRVEAERALAESEALYRAVLESSPDAVALTDLDGTITLVSPQNQKIFNHKSVDDFIGRSVNDYLDPTEWESAEKNIRRIHAGEQNDPQVYLMVKATGERFYGETSSSVIRNERGEPTKMLTFIRDVTDRVRDREKLERFAAELRQTNAEKDRFFAIVAHDLRSPFHGLLGLSKTLRDTLNELPPEKIQRSASLLHDSADYLYQLVENLHRWSRLQRDMMPFDPEPVRLDEIVESATTAVAASAEAKGVALKNEATLETTLVADKPMTVSIAQNLLTNAVKFTSPGGSVTVRIEEETDAIRLVVADTGVGMAPETARNLFKVDKRSTSVGTANETGAGLGLLIVKDMVAKHNGEIAVDSEEGVGTTFTVTLPKSR
ncbi:MAG: PAS domain S-box protein [Ignavibacteriales bacterium]|nr:PAS domain S-box protein [Ignavibacteriales bacterium]